jgi:signal transduction histidine kinase
MVDIRRLRGVELFAGLTDEQFGWLATQGSLRELADGTILFEDGDEGGYFYVLLEGELLITKVINGEERVITRHVAHPDGPGPDGKPSAASQYTGELPMLADGYYVAKGTTVGRTEVIAYDKPTFLEILARCPRICHVLLPVLAWRIRSYERQSSHSVMLEGLGRLAGGLMHELNNPAAAAVRAIGDLAAALAGMADWAVRWGSQATTAERAALAPLVAGPPPATPTGFCDAADEITGLLADHGVRRPAELAYVLADSGMTPSGLRSLPVRPETYEAAISFLAYSLQARDLVAEASEATRRIESLVAAAKTYANASGAPLRDVNLAEELEAVLAMHAARLSGIEVLRDYADVPAVPAYANELNQVWSNLIENAVDAMNGAGELRLRISRDGAAAAVVEIGDNGPGIPPEIMPRLFQPFFTTKDIGKGTGLGLHLSRDIVVHRHNGSIDVTSLPGDTRFSVRLPLSPHESH